MTRYELGIVDTRNIIRTLDEDYKYDFKNYALTFFKRRLEYIISFHNLKDADGLLKKLKADKKFLPELLRFLAVDTTEMFRDPSLWRLLKDDVLPKAITNPGYKIWLPEVGSGEELYSLLITLRTLKLSDKVRIFASSISSMQLENIQKGYFLARKAEVNDANFKRVFSEGELKQYYKTDEEHAYWDTDLLKGVEFIHDNLIPEKGPKGVKLILFRNQMIYFNQILQERYLKLLHHHLVPAGYLIIGNNEVIDYWNSDKDYNLVNDSERIFKKKLS
jgi:chemotaxis protein methyltransferase CheR